MIGDDIELRLGVAAPGVVMVSRHRCRLVAFDRSFGLQGWGGVVSGEPACWAGPAGEVDHWRPR
jgi:hypothetical protein